MLTFTISLFVGRKLGDGNNNRITAKRDTMDFSETSRRPGLCRRHSPPFTQEYRSGIEINNIKQQGKKIGLKINQGKTKTMQINGSNTDNFKINGEELEKVNKFTYLGSIMSNDGGTDKDIKCRIGKAAAVFKTLRPIWTSSQISINTKLKIFNSNVKSVLLYASETWRTTKAATHRLQTFTNRCLRNILKIKWQDMITNEELWERTNQPLIEDQIKKRKWTWIGHTLRKPKTTIVNQALRWNPQGQRKPGRPRNSWRRSVEQEGKQQGKTWAEIDKLAQDRRKWKSFTDDLCPGMDDRV